MMNFIQNFHADESGAVTVDWVVLTAAVIGMGILVVNSIGGGASTMANNIQTELETTVPDIAF